MEEKKILLALLPLWDPLIPPLGIACLKSYLQRYGFQVKTVDANIEPGLGEVHKNYFNCIKEFVPEEKRRHLYNIGHEVLKKHMMAHINQTNEKDYKELIKTLVLKTFFTSIFDHQVLQLNQIIRTFFSQLEDYLIELLDQERPGVLGLSVYSGTLAASLFAARLARSRISSLQIVLGGGIFSGELAIDSPEFELFLEKIPYIDKIIVGEGEHLFLRFLRGQLPASPKAVTLKDLNEETLDITKVGVPDFSDFKLRQYMQWSAYTSRSCPFQCSFCVETTYWGKYRKKSGHQVFKELIQLKEKYHKRLFLMCDSLLNPVIAGIAEAGIKAESTVYWGGYLRVSKEVCDPQNTLLWRRGGFYRARLGVESGSPRILEKMKKKITPDQIKKAVSSLAFAGIKTTLMFVIGYPGETEKDFQETLNLIRELRDDIYEADCNPFWYFLTGQGHSEEWMIKKKAIPLYPENFREMFMVQTWILDCSPARSETYKRVNRFIQHCLQLGIPNPYSLKETQQADERWRQLHPNAVPPLIQINSNQWEKNENEKIEELNFANNIIPQSEGDWSFD